MVAILHCSISRVRRVNRQRATIRCLDLEIIVDAATGDIRDVHAMPLYAHIRGVNVIHHDIERNRATLRFFPGAQDEMGAAAQLEHRKIRVFNNGANAELDEEMSAITGVPREYKPRYIAAGASVIAAQRITSSARRRSVGGNVTPRAWAVLRLRTNSTFLACSMGSSAGVAPLRILST